MTYDISHLQFYRYVCHAFTYMHVFRMFFFHTVLDESGTWLVNNPYHGHSKQVGSFRLLSSGIPIPVGGSWRTTASGCSIGTFLVLVLDAVNPWVFPNMISNSRWRVITRCTLDILRYTCMIIYYMYWILVLLQVAQLFLARLGCHWLFLQTVWLFTMFFFKAFCIKTAKDVNTLSWIYKGYGSSPCPTGNIARNWWILWAILIYQSRMCAFHWLMQAIMQPPWPNDWPREVGHSADSSLGQFQVFDIYIDIRHIRHWPWCGVWFQDDNPKNMVTDSQHHSSATVPIRWKLTWILN